MYPTFADSGESDFFLVLGALTAERLLEVGANGVEALLPDHVDDTSANDLLWGQTQPPGIGFTYPQIMKAAAAPGNRRSHRVDNSLQILKFGAFRMEIRSNRTGSHDDL